MKYKFIISVILMVLTAATVSTAQTAKKQNSFTFGKIKLTAGPKGKIEFDFTKNIASASGNVNFTSKDANITSNSLMLKFDSKEKILDSGTAKGNVKISLKQTGNRSMDATCELAELSDKGDTVILTGNPEVIVTDPKFEEPSTLVGDRIIMHIKDRKITAESESKQTELRITPKETQTK